MRLFLTAGLGVLGIFANSNVSWWHTSRQTFAGSLDRAVQLGTDWIVSRPERENTALLYMISDMADLSGDLRLRRIGTNFLTDPFAPADDVWRRMLAPSAKVRRPARWQLDSLQDYQRWFVYAIAPHEVELTDAERTAMFAPDRFVWGSRTHQLFALILYRSRADNSLAVTELVNHLCEKIAFEEQWDIRVTDLYLQRMAFILAAGRSDLIRPRWVERAIASQEEDGGWVSSWYGWGPGLFAFSFRPRVPNSHTTIQGVWLLYMLKYRYPEWIQRNYPDTPSKTAMTLELLPLMRTSASNRTASLSSATAFSRRPRASSARP
jgi:hypothetical protein